jgi:hypothetical protein
MAAENLYSSERWFRTTKEQHDEIARRLKSGGGDGTSGGVDTTDAKIAAAEARTDTKFAELRGDMKDFVTKGALWAATGTIIATILGVLLAVLAFGGDRFDAGITAGGALAPYAEQQRARDAAQDRKFDEILRRLPPPDRARDR